MIALAIAAAIVVIATLGEWLHARRCRRVGRLAFGPSGKARAWTALVPVLRVLALGAVAWGMAELSLMKPRAARRAMAPEGGYRHLIIALDVSPSMQLKDGGPERKLTRARRAAEVILSVLERVALEQMRVSIVAFYTGAKPVVVDTYDLEVVKNILNDLPLEMAFTPGKTSLIEGIKESVALAKGWLPGSTTLLVASDGDTLPDRGLPELPPSISQVLILGVGNARAGANIDGHMSRQDPSTLRQLATRMRGDYHDVNERHLPSQQLAKLSEILPMREDSQATRRELALGAVGVGASLLALIPVALALAGTGYRPGVRSITAKPPVPPGATPLSTQTRAGAQPRIEAPL